jgi:hypothetical protein
LTFHSEREADHSSPSSAEVKKWVELYLHSPNTPSWRGAQLGGAQGQLYFRLKYAFSFFVLNKVWILQLYNPPFSVFLSVLLFSPEMCFS